jgi:hypothetical protein
MGMVGDGRRDLLEEVEGLGLRVLVERVELLELARGQDLVDLEADLLTNAIELLRLRTLHDAISAHARTTHAHARTHTESAPYGGDGGWVVAQSTHGLLVGPGPVHLPLRLLDLSQLCHSPGN